MNVEVLAHAIQIIRLFWSDLSFQADGSGPVDGDEGFLAVKSSSDTSSSSFGVTFG